MQEEIYQFLELHLGGDCDFNDYESKESLLEYAIELVQEQEELTQGCGVGPILHHIQSWIDQFEKETHCKKLDSKLQDKVAEKNKLKM